jgi:hypothetical protein
VLEKWKADLPLVLGSRGLEKFSELLVSNRYSVAELCQSWKLDEVTAYTLEAVKGAVTSCIEKLDVLSDRQARELKLETYLCSKLLAWERWPDAEFRAQAARVILSTYAEKTSNKEVKELVVSDQRLGDPRLPRNEPNWNGYSKAQRSVTEWLSRDDISFFFEQVIPPRHNQHRRKRFWLTYADQIKRSRPLLLRRHRAELARLKDKVGNFGSYDHDFTSAFVLDFGQVAAVEFSEKGNACFVYERRSFDKLVPGAELWAPTPFSERQLKNRDTCIARITHDVHGYWIYTLENLLARYGIRSGK